MINFSQGGAAKIKSKQFSEFGLLSWTKVLTKTKQNKTRRFCCFIIVFPLSNKGTQWTVPLTEIGYHSLELLP